MSTPYGGNESQHGGRAPTPDAQSGGLPVQGYPAPQPGQSQPGHVQLGQAPAGQAQPGQAQAGQTQLGQVQPGQTQPAQVQPGYGHPQYGQQPQYGQTPQYGQQLPYGQQFPQQQYGTPPAFGERKAIGKTVWIVMGAVVAVVAAVCVTGLWAPGFFVTRVLDQSAVQNGVRTVLTSLPPNGYGQPKVTAVSCPAKQPVKAGTTFDCSVTVDGKQKTVTIAVKDTDANYEVGQAH